jgi:hypothetical protein
MTAKDQVGTDYTGYRVTSGRRCNPSRSTDASRIGRQTEDGTRSGGLWQRNERGGCADPVVQRDRRAVVVRVGNAAHRGYKAIVVLSDQLGRLVPTLTRKHSLKLSMFKLMEFTKSYRRKCSVCRAFNPNSTRFVPRSVD